jgi:hypothetical protein
MLHISKFQEFLCEFSEQFLHGFGLDSFLNV